MVAGLKDSLERRFGLQDYLIWSTVIAALMLVQVRGTIEIGYIIVIINSLILLSLNQLKIHRNHFLALLALTGFSLIGAFLSGTPLNAPISQLVGISVLSIYFFSALTTLGPSLEYWLEIYMRAAFTIAIVGIIRWAVGRFVPGADPRLIAIYSEPSFFVYVTLPALGYCVNRFAAEGRYGWESLIFVLSYVLADSAIGFLGIFLVGILTYVPRLKGRQLLGGIVIACCIIPGLYLASANVRLRAYNMATAIARQNLSATDPTTFAFLSNIYVTAQSFSAHPFTGIGLGGYANAYDKYIGNITGADSLESLGSQFIESMQLNRDDAASMFLRITAELGIFGLLLLIGFLVVCGRVRGVNYTTIRNAILPYLVMRMTRMGHYFTVELYFFVGIYLLNYRHYVIDRRRIRSRSL